MLQSSQDLEPPVKPERFNMNQLFEPFSRLGAENTNVEGTGIGLTITKNLVVLMGGEIFAESIHGAGGTFSIILPTTPG
jgi:signal transduction histidine kinase